MNESRYEANPPMFRNNPLGFILSILLIAVYGVGLLILLVWFLKCKATKLVIENNEILWEQGLLTKQRTELHTSKVRTVKVKQSLMQRMFGTGDIELYTAGDFPEVVLAGMPQPMELRSLIKKGMM